MTTVEVELDAPKKWRVTWYTPDGAAGTDTKRLWLRPSATSPGMFSYEIEHEGAVIPVQGSWFRSEAGIRLCADGSIETPQVH